jgi:23S rRNA pseudouridine1911/1915/1917 synthase
MEIKIIYEDDNLLILDTPAGVTVNNSDTTQNQETVQDFISKRYSNFTNPVLNDESDFFKRAGIVHRIDKETSGILIAAKTKSDFENLQTQFKDRVVEKTYVALVHGNIDEDEGKISVPVGRLPWNRKRFGVLAGGREAETNYKVLERFNKPFTLLQLNPKTGRTHQIRVHLKYFNHPVFADFLYAGRKTARDDRKILPRVFLHAKKISFIHPKTGDRVEFESPIPHELTAVINSLKN